MTELDDLRKRVEALEAWRARVVAGLGAAAGVASKGATPNGSKGGGVATDADLDGRYGDPKVKKDPPRWNGQRYSGAKYSETDPAYLHCLADFLDWRADQEELDPERQKYAAYSRADAARARGWAARFANGHKAPDRAQRNTFKEGPTDERPRDDQPRNRFDGDDEIPF